MTDILIVEDDKELSSLLTDFLRAEGYTVSAVESGEKAVGIFQKYGAKLVVLDINLPDINGFAVCSKLREKADLTAKEFDLLALLMENKDKALKKEYLFNTVWGSDSDSELQTLHVHINRLRSKLGDDPKNVKRLLTVWGVGYKFV